MLLYARQDQYLDGWLYGNPIAELRQRHLPYGITHCYLRPDTSKCAPP